MPISFLLLREAKETNPSRPKQAIIADTQENRLTSLLNRSSDLYWALNELSRKKYSNGRIVFSSFHLLLASSTTDLALPGRILTAINWALSVIRIMMGDCSNLRDPK